MGTLAGLDALALCSSTSSSAWNWSFSGSTGIAPIGLFPMTVSGALDSTLSTTIAGASYIFPKLRAKVTLRCRPHRQPGHTCAGEIELSVIMSNAVDAAADDDEVDDDCINELFWLTIAGAANVAVVVVVVVVVVSACGLTASFRHAFGNPTSTQQQVSLTLLQPSGLTRRL